MARVMFLEDTEGEGKAVTRLSMLRGLLRKVDGGMALAYPISIH